MKRKSKRKAKRLSKLLKFHNIVGLFVCLVLIHLSVTGIFLNHTDKLNLSKTKISWNWLLNAYGMTVPKTDVAFAIGDNFFHQTNSQIFMNTQSIMRSKHRLVGVISFNEQFIISTSNSIVSVNKLGDFNKEIDLPESSMIEINKIGTYSNGIVIKTNESNFLSDKNLENWSSRSNIDKIIWATESNVPSNINKKIKAYYVGEGITLEQIILDLHSGVIFKSIGKLFMDFIALLLIFMSISGVWIWFIKKNK